MCRGLFTWLLVISLTWIVGAVGEFEPEMIAIALRRVLDPNIDCQRYCHASEPAVQDEPTLFKYSSYGRKSPKALLPAKGSAKTNKNSGILRILQVCMGTRHAITVMSGHHFFR